MADTECIISNTEISILQDSSANEINNDDSTETQFETVRKSDIVSVLLTKTNQQQKNIVQIVKNAVAIQLCDANGSAKSIIKWGCKCNLDKHQRHAFEVIAASLFSHISKMQQRTTNG